jgi:hypothetical protein
LTIRLPLDDGASSKNPTETLVPLLDVVEAMLANAFAALPIMIDASENAYWLRL